MSAGTFLKNAKYETDKTTVARVRIQPETLTLTINGTVNAEPAGAVTPNYPRAKVSKTNREIGIGCRGVYFRFTGTLPDGYAMNSILFLPVLTVAFYGSISDGDTGTYEVNGTTAAIEVVGRKAESFR